MKFPPRFLGEVRGRLPLSEQIGKKLRLIRAGREYKACCPFHKEKTPSFYVNDEKGFYHCFGCGAHGDVIGWTMQYENRSFPEAIEQLAAQAGLEMPKLSPEAHKQAEKEKSLYQLMTDTAAFFEDQLHAPQNHDALNYITGRGYTDETLSAFRIGYAPGDRTLLHAYLKERGYTDAHMKEAGLIRTDKTGKPYSFFRDRVMFPVTDRRGRVVAFGGRILPDHLRPPDRGDFTSPKYINSSDTPLFHKGRMLYGAAHAGYAARDGEKLIVVEGYLDVMACWQAGIKGAVAPLGTALTEDQISALWRMIPEAPKVPVLCFDGDEAGRRAAARAADRLLPLLQPGQSAEIVFLPEGEDPDSLIKAQGRAAFDKLVAQALPLSDFLWHSETEGKRFDTPEERAALNKTLEDLSKQISDRDLQFQYLQNFRDKARAFFKPQARSSGGWNSSNPNHHLKAVAPSAIRPSGRALEDRCKHILLATALCHPYLFDEIEEQLGSLDLQNPELIALREALFEAYSVMDNENKLDFSGIKSHLNSVGLGDALARLLRHQIMTHAAFIDPKTEYNEVVEGWKATWALMQKPQTRTARSLPGR